MGKEYDFSKGTRGPVLDTSGKERVAIWLDSEVLEYFCAKAGKQGTGYQGLINRTLRDAMHSERPSHNGAAPHEAAPHDDDPAKQIDTAQVIGQS